MRNRRGMTVIELLIAMTVFLLVLASALTFLSRQLQAFGRNQAEMSMLQNLSFANDVLNQELRLAGARVPDQQPPVIYAGTDAFIFNADYASNTDSLFAAYFNPALPSGEVSALTLARQIVLPGTSPAFTYPAVNYYADGNAAINSPAETISWVFQPDTSTPASNDFVLMRQVNDRPPEPVVRNVIRTPGTNFFRYSYRRIPVSGTASATVDTVPSAWMPLRHSVPLHASTADTGSAARIDSLVAVDVSFTVTNGLTGAAFRSRPITFTVPLLNLTTKEFTACGSPPILGTALTASWRVTATPPDTLMLLTWSRATDETGGERDVRAYVIWRRPKGAPDWGEPIATVAAGSPTPSWQDQTAKPVAPGYDYALAAQDCSGQLSTLATASPPIAPP